MWVWVTSLLQKTNPSTMTTILKYLFAIVLFIIATIFSEAMAQKSISAYPINEAIKIDGELSEAIWKENLIDGSFIQTTPENGKPSTRKTEIAVLYDQSYLYIAASLFINNKKEINSQLTARDDLGSSDFFGIQIDPFGEAREGYDFSITAAGVQFDEKITENSGYINFNVVWISKVKIYDDKWVVELKIPFNSVRFPKEDMSKFRINFQRFSSQLNEESFWSPIDPEKDGYLAQFGKLEGLPIIEPPLNLSFIPFVSAINEKSPDGINNTTLNGGMDVKYVYNNAYTLDVSLIPDFSQAQSDDQVFNLSPFEIKFDENRQFFVEGTEIFDKGGYLYTRRIGGSPINKNKVEIAQNEGIISNPVSSNILNLVKVTGKSSTGFSIGLLNGLTAKSEAKFLNTETQEFRTVETNPLTNYNSLVLDQALKNNSSITLINNSVLRRGTDYDANLTALLYRWYNAKRTYTISAKKAVSQQYFSDEKDNIGHEYYLFLGKVSGKCRGAVSTSLYDKNYNPNDFGYLSRNNRLTFTGDVSFSENNPIKVFARYRLGLIHQRIYYHSFMEQELAYYKLQSSGNFKKNNHSFFADLTYVEEGKNFYEARKPDRPFLIPAQTETFLEYQTNRNRNISFSGYAVYVQYLDSKIFDREFIAGYGVRARIGQHLFAYFSQAYESKPNNAGFLTTEGDTILFGQRSIDELVNTFQLEYSVNSKMSMNMRLRHYWIQVDYKKQLSLQENGSLIDNNLDIAVTDFNDNFNQFNVDIVARWQFAPASEISLGYKLGANAFDTNVKSSYFDNLSDVLKSDNSQTVSLKMTYFLDINRFRKVI